MLRHEILGDPGRDNALYVVVDTGHLQTRLLFDCGEGCLTRLKHGDVMAIDHVFFSHFHMDHVAGFDGFFRANYGREMGPVEVWGPPGAIEIMHHRFQGFLWNLHGDRPGLWRVHEIQDTGVASAEFFLAEAFTERHPLERASRDENGTVLRLPDFSVSAIELDHGTPSMGYLVREASKINIDPQRLRELGLPGGRWLEQVKSEASGDLEVEIGGKFYGIGELKEKLLLETPGASLAYLTDFELGNDAELERVANFIQGCDFLICECQYRHEDLDLAQKNRHLTAKQAGRLASSAGVGALCLFHLSERYAEEEWPLILAEARAEFGNTHFSPSWEID